MSHRCVCHARKTNHTPPYKYESHFLFYCNSKKCFIHHKTFTAFLTAFTPDSTQTSNHYQHGDNHQAVTTALLIPYLDNSVNGTPSFMCPNVTSAQKEKVLGAKLEIKHFISGEILNSKVVQ